MTVGPSCDPSGPLVVPRHQRPRNSVTQPATNARRCIHPSRNLIGRLGYKAANVLQVTNYGTKPSVSSTIDCFPLGFEGNMQISTTLEPRQHWHPGGWFVAKAGLALVAILLLSLTVATLEMRLRIMPTDDSATDWILSGAVLDVFDVARARASPTSRLGHSRYSSPFLRRPLCVRRWSQGLQNRDRPLPHHTSVRSA
jgi:hypothetical protein